MEGYRGADRRSRPHVARTIDPRPAALTMLAIWCALIVIPRAVPILVHAVRPLDRLDVAAGALAVVAGVAAFLRWVFDGRARSWWIGLGLIVIGVPGLASTDQADAHLTLTVAASIVAALLFAGSWRSADVNTALSIPKAAALLAAALTATFGSSDALARLSLPVYLSPYVGAVMFGTLAFAWHRSAKSETWMLLPLVGFSLVCGIWAVVPDPLLRAAEGAFMQFVANGIAAAGALGALHASATQDRKVALAAQRDRDLADSRRTEVEARYAETLHEVRSTVVALEGGMRSLQPPHEAAPRASLARALVAELQRLRELVDPDQAPAESEFGVREALEPLLTVSEAGGWPVRWNIPADLRGRGRAADVAQITHALLTNARRYAPGSPIEVSATNEDGYVVLHVDDRGPGVNRAHRELIFERGERSEHHDDVDGRGLGLHIARRLAREIEGDLWVEARPGGGARFVLVLRAACTAASTDTMLDQHRTAS